MSNVPLPNRSCIVTYMGDGRGLHYTLSVAAGTALIEQPPGSQLDLYTADQMHAHAAAVSAAKDAEIAALRADFTALQRAIVGDTGASAILEAGRLRAEVAGLRAELLKSLADNAALRERVKVLEDALRGMVIANERHSFLRVGDALTAARAALEKP